MARVMPAVVVHTAYVQSGERLDKVNVQGSANVAAAAAAAGARLLHLSTDFVFDGEGGAPTASMTRRVRSPTTADAKLAAERRVAEADPGALIVRTSLIYGGAQPGRPRAAGAGRAGRSRRRLLHRRAALAGCGAPTSPTRCWSWRGCDVSGLLHVAGPQPLSRFQLAPPGGARARPRAAPAAAGPKRRSGAAATARLRARQLACAGAAGHPLRGVDEVLGAPRALAAALDFPHAWQPPNPACRWCAAAPCRRGLRADGAGHASGCCGWWW